MRLGSCWPVNNATTGQVRVEFFCTSTASDWRPVGAAMQPKLHRWVLPHLTHRAWLRLTWHGSAQSVPRRRRATGCCPLWATPRSHAESTGHRTQPPHHSWATRARGTQSAHGAFPTGRQLIAHGIGATAEVVLLNGTTIGPLSMPPTHHGCQAPCRLPQTRPGAPTGCAGPGTRPARSTTG